MKRKFLNLFFFLICIQLYNILLRICRGNITKVQVMFLAILHIRKHGFIFFAIMWFYYLFITIFCVKDKLYPLHNLNRQLKSQFQHWICWFLILFQKYKKFLCKFSPSCMRRDMYFFAIVAFKHKKPQNLHFTEIFRYVFIINIYISSN